MASNVETLTTSSSTAAAELPRDAGRHGTAVWLVAGGLVALFAPTMLWLWGRWTLSVWHHAHGLLILPVVAYFVREKLQVVRHLPASSSAWGFAVLIPALVLHALDAGMHTELLSAMAIVVALPGLSLLFLGVPRTRAILIPLLFLVFALPIPLTFTEAIHLQLRLVATAATAAVIPHLGIPVFVEGTTLNLPLGALQVADACSGFSTLYAALAVAFLTAYSTQSSARRLLVLVAAAPLAIGANILRVVTLVLLVVWQGPGVLETFIHPLSGMMTFALALPVIFWLGGDTARSEDPAPPRSQS